MEVTANYNWKGQLASYKRGNSFVPIAEGNRDYQEIRDALAKGECIVHEPTIERVVSAYNQRGQLSGYQWNGMFVPIDETNELFRKISHAIKSGKCIVEEPSQRVSIISDQKVQTLIFAILFDRPWHHVKDEYRSDLPYRSHDTSSSHSYTFTLRNVCSDSPSSVADIWLKLYGIDRTLVGIFSPFRCGVLEIELPSDALLGLYRAERSMLAEHTAEFLHDQLSQRLLELGRSPKRGPDLEWLLFNAKYYLENFLIDFGNRVGQAYAIEYGDLPAGYIDRWKVYHDTIVVYRMADGSHRLGAFGFQGRTTYELSGEWVHHAGLSQMSSPPERPVHPYDYALGRARMLLRTGFHLEALCLVDAFLEVSVKDSLRACAGGQMDVVEAIGRRRNHRQRLELLKEVVGTVADEIVRTDVEYRERISRAGEIQDYRNAYLHDVSLPGRFDAPLLDTRQRLQIERLLEGFVDFSESRVWLAMQQRLVSMGDPAVVQLLRERTTDGSIGADGS